VFQNKVIIALGTNIGNWKNNFNQALFELNKIGFISNFGSIYYSKPFGFKNQSFFYNTAIEFITLANPIKLLQDIQIIEKKIKKNKFFVNGPRRIDLDIIFYNKIILKKNNLIIPHPRAHLRDFVLYPIKDMSPFYIHPTKKKTINNLVLELKENYILKRINRTKESLLIY
tara:strand:- start:765 stop:1277 length:513 start_codon:yes stop_codon:yes gene_type:complete